MRTLLALPIVLVADFGLAQGRWSVELYTGASFKAPTTLEIRKDGHEPGTIDGVRYDTRAFVPVRSLADLGANDHLLRVGYLFAPTRPDARFAAKIEWLHDKA